MKAMEVASRGLVQAARGGLAGVVSKRRKAAALVVAGVADLIQLALFPLFFGGALSPFDDALDAVVALVLFLTLGWRWRMLAALALELVPGAALFPSWTAVVATLPVAPAPGGPTSAGP